MTPLLEIPLSWQTEAQQLIPAFREMASADQAALLQQLERFYQRLIEQNQAVNLTRITEPQGFLYRHVLDSWLLAAHIPAGARVMDVGSGGGFPAIPLALLRPDIQLTAVESVQKKGVFIQEASSELGLGKRLQVLTERSEILGHQPPLREQFDVVTARAVAGLPVLLELCLPFTKVEGVFLAMKGPGYPAELEAATHALSQLGGVVGEVVTHTLQENTTAILSIQKAHPTSARYPRKPGVPGKKPL